MNELIRIEDVEVQKIVYRDQPVLTLADIDRVHGRPEGAARKNFNNNREKFTFGRDFFDLPYEEWSILNEQNLHDQVGALPDQKDVGGRRGNKIFITLHGYLKLVKSFNDERAWKVYDILVDSYFDLKVLQKAAQKDIKFIELQDKYIALLEKVVAEGPPKARKSHTIITDEEKKQIMDLYSRKVSFSEIARLVGRSRSSISNLIHYGETSGMRVVLKLKQQSDRTEFFQ